MEAEATGAGAEELIPIGELSRRTDLAVSALRYYEELGLLEPHARVSGKRRYRVNAIAAAGLIRLLRDVHFTLSEIAEMMGAEAGDRDVWRALAGRKVAELDALIAKAGAARGALDHALQCPHDIIGECPTFREIVVRHQGGEPLASAHAHGHTGTRHGADG